MPVRPPPLSAPTPPESASRTARTGLLAAAVTLLVVRQFVPFGRQALYPFTLFGTWVHECGHGVTALLTGGSFRSLDIFSDASGLAYTSTVTPLARPLVSAGGLLGPPLLGAFVLAFARGPRRATVLFTLLAAALALSTALWVRNATGLVTLPALALGFALFAWVSPRPWRTAGAQFVGLLLALDTVTRIDYLFTGRAMIGGSMRESDVSAIADVLGGHYLLWGSLLAAISVALLAVGLRLSWGRSPSA